MVDSPIDFRRSVYQTLIGRGLNPQQAMGAMYSLMGESGTGLSPGAYNPNDPGGSMGFAQWNGSRRAGLQAVARKMGTSETDPNAQLAYFNQELNGPYKNVVSDIRANANTAADATKIWTADFEQPKVNNWQARYARGSRMAGLDATGNPTFSGAPALGSVSGATVPGTTLTSTPATAVSRETPAAPSPALSPYQMLQKGDVQGALSALAAPKTDAQGNQQKSALAQIGQAFEPKQQQQQQMQSEPMLQPQDNSTAMIGPSQQLLAQVLAAGAKPLSWSSQPYGSGLAGQAPGMTLNTAGGLYG